jgi:hypothetical protein
VPVPVSPFLSLAVEPHKLPEPAPCPRASMDSTFLLSKLSSRDAAPGNRHTAPQPSALNNQSKPPRLAAVVSRGAAPFAVVSRRTGVPQRSTSTGAPGNYLLTSALGGGQKKPRRSKPSMIDRGPIFNDYCQSVGGGERLVRSKRRPTRRREPGGRYT